MKNKILLILAIIIILVIAGYFLYQNSILKPSGISEEDCLDRGGRVVTLEDQLKGENIDGKVIGNIRYSQNGAQCVKG